MAQCGGPRIKSCQRKYFSMILIKRECIKIPSCKISSFRRHWFAQNSSVNTHAEYKEITTDQFICCDSQRFNFILQMTILIPPVYPPTHASVALSCAFSFKGSYEQKTNPVILMRVRVTATETKSSKIASSKRFFIETVSLYPIQIKLHACLFFFIFFLVLFLIENKCLHSS